MDLVKPTIWKSFRRSQLASMIATLADYGTLVLLVEVFRVWYVAATAAGAFVGAVTNFILGRHWSFKAAGGRLHHQASRYALISGMSLVFNSVGVYLLTDRLGLRYIESKMVISLLVGLLFNFPMHRGYVFR